jgi:hypothetical protein
LRPKFLERSSLKIGCGKVMSLEGGWSITKNLAKVLFKLHFYVEFDGRLATKFDNNVLEIQA